MGDRRAGWGQARVSRASPRPTLTWTQQQNLGTRSVRCGCSQRPLTPPRNTHAQSHHVRATCPASRVRACRGGASQQSASLPLRLLRPHPSGKSLRKSPKPGHNGFRFTVENTEAQGERATCQRHTNRGRWLQDFIPEQTCPSHLFGPF